MKLAKAALGAGAILAMLIRALSPGFAVEESLR